MLLHTVAAFAALDCGCVVALDIRLHTLLSLDLMIICNHALMDLSRLLQVADYLDQTQVTLPRLFYLSIIQLNQQLGRTQFAQQVGRATQG